MKPRKNELSPVLHRSLLEQVPPGIDSHKWHKFRDRYNNAAKLKINDSPAQIDIELNSSCNLKCNFCIQSVRDLGKFVLGFDCFKRLINEAVANGTTSLKLNYMNEPLIIQDLEKYIIYAKEAGMVNVFMSTNGIMLTEARSKSLIESGITKIFISLDATTPDVFKEQRNSPKFNLIVENILRLIEIRNNYGQEYPLVRVNFLKNKSNLHQEQDFIEFWQDKADMIIIQEMNELIDNESNLFIKTDKKDYKCSFPFKQLVVDARGRILPCCCMNGTELQLGHVDSMTLKQAWNSTKMKDLRELHLNGDYRENPVCNRCINGTL
jgi:radical SAM protein with 4Fe4S-binding SPASM domain